jgi:hypothetical protein
MNVIAFDFVGNILSRAFERREIQSSNGAMGEAPRPSQKVYRQRTDRPTRLRHLADARLTAARIKWNRVIFRRRAKR